MKSSQQPRFHYMILLPIFLTFIVTSIGVSNPPTIHYTYSTVLAAGKVQFHAGIELGGVSGEVWFEWKGSTGSTFYDRTNSITLPVDSGNVIDIVDTIDVDTATGGFEYRCVSVSDTDTTYGRVQHASYDHLVSSPSVIMLDPERLATTSFDMNAICNPNGSTVSFHFSWGLDWRIENGRSPSVTLGPFNHDTLITFELTHLTPYTEYFIRAVANNVSYPDIWGINARLVSTQTLYDSTARGLTVPLYIQGGSIAAGTNGYGVAMNLGVNSNATDCYDYGLGEDKLPPPPPFMDIRIVDRYQGPAACLIDGTYTDLRKYTDSTQVDTFHIRMMGSADYYPLNIYWSDLAEKYSGPVIIRSLIDSADMRATNHFQVSNPAVSLLIITAAGPKPKLHTPNLLINRIKIVQSSSATLTGEVNPTGLPTVAWFEWGESTTYGQVTDVDNVGGGFGSVKIATEVTGLNPEVSYHYRIVASNSADTIYGIDQMFTTMSVTGIDGSDNIPLDYELSQNYPNPFNPSTTIRYTIPTQEYVSVKIFNMLGQEIETLVGELKFPGAYLVSWNAEEYPSGIYFCQLSTQKIDLVRKMLFIR